MTENPHVERTQEMLKQTTLSKNIRVTFSQNWQSVVCSHHASLHPKHNQSNSFPPNPVICFISIKRTFQKTAEASKHITTAFEIEPTRDSHFERLETLLRRRSHKTWKKFPHPCWRTDCVTALRDIALSASSSWLSLAKNPLPS